MAIQVYNVIQQDIAYIETDKGNLYFVVQYIDAPIVVGDEYRQLETSRYLGRESIYAHWNNTLGLVVTEFSTLDGKFRCDETVWHYDHIFRYGVQDYYIWGNTISVPPANVRCTGPWCIVVGNNNVPYATITDSFYAEDIGVSNVTLNTATEIGKCSFNRPFAPNFAGGVSEIGVHLGEYLLEKGVIPSGPYQPGGETDPEVGPTEGDWTLPTDELALPGTSYSDLSAGLYRIYAMTPSQVNSFASQLWNTDVMDIISRFFEKPTDVVLGLYSYPFDVQSGTAENVYFNWISQWSTVDVTGHPVTQEIQHLEFGYVDVPRYSGTFYDFQPYSVIQMHLPYIGFVELKPNEVVGKRVYLDYYVSVFSGDFTAALTVTGDNSPGLIGLYQGNIGRPVPLTQQDLFSLFKKGAVMALTTASAIVSGGAAAVAGKEFAEAKDKYEQTIEQGLPIAGVRSDLREAKKTHDEALSRFKRVGLATAANALLSNPSGPAILRNGAVDAASGRTSSQEAYMLITIPHQNVSSEQKLLGYPTNLPGPLSGYSGFTTVREIRLDVPNATDSERAEIEQIVRGGIII